MKKLKTRTCLFCNTEYQTRLETKCCSRSCSNKHEAQKRKTQINPETGLSKSQEISIASAKTMKEKGWYGSEKHLKSLKHTPEVRLKRGKAIREAMLKIDETTGETKATVAARKQALTKIDKGLYLDPKFKKELQLYADRVRVLTEKNDLSSLDGYEYRGRAGIEGATHLDHIYSIKAGFINNVDPKIIASIHNLRFIPFEENLKKSDDCDITLSDLISNFENA